MTKFWLINLLILIPCALSAQFKKNDWWIGASYDNIGFKDLPHYNAVGIKGEYMLTNTIGVEFGLTGSRDNIHVGAGTLLGPLFFALTSSSNDNSVSQGVGGLVLIAITAASMLEHTNYHIRINDNIHISPYLSLLRFRYMYDRENPFVKYNTDQFGSWSVGTKLSFITKDKWIINGYIERSQLYYIGTPASLQAGLNIGRIIKSKKTDKENTE